MERLCEKLLKIINEQDFCFTPEEMRVVEKGFRRFKAYESIGLSPKEVKDLESFRDFPSSRLQEASELLFAKDAGRLVVLPFPQGATLLERFPPLNPELLENFHVAITYTYCGLVFHQPFNIFLENVKRGYISEMSKETDAVLEAQKGGDER